MMLMEELTLAGARVPINGLFFFFSNLLQEVQAD